MKPLFIKYPEYTRNYNSLTHGWQFLGMASDLISKIIHFETIFDQDNGTYTDQQGNEVYDPENPEYADFKDYEYYLLDKDHLNDDQKKAIELSNFKHEFI